MLTALALAGAGDEMLDTLETLVGRDGVRAPLDAVASELGRLCDGGLPSACDLARAGLDGTDPAAVGAVLESACAGGDRAACVGVAWGLLPRDARGLDVSMPSDPERYRSLVADACEAGIHRGCIELGAVHRYGIDTYPSLARARYYWEPECSAGSGRACALLAVAENDRVWLDDSVALGDPLGIASLAEVDSRAREDGLQRACEAGVTWSCTELAMAGWASEPERVRLALQGACELRDPFACTDLVRFDAVTGALSADEAIPRLERWCPEVPAACEQAEFLRQGAPSRLVYGTIPAASDVEMFEMASLARLEGCLVDLLLRDPEAEGLLDAVISVGPRGRTEAVYVSDPIEPEHHACVVRELSDRFIGVPYGDSARIEVKLPVYHSAEVDLLADTEASGREIPLLRGDLPSWSAPLEQCFMAHDRPESGVELWLKLQARADGTFRDIVVTRSTETPELDRCVLDWISHRTVISPPRFSARVEVRIRFLVAMPKPSISPTRPEPEPSAPVTDPVVLRQLVLLVDRTRTSSGIGRLSRRAGEDIEAAHRQMAEYVEAATHGAVQIELEVRQVDAQLGLASPVDFVVGAKRWMVPTSDWPIPILDAIEPGRWDSVFLWSALPKDSAPPSVGYTPTSTLRGATTSIAFVTGPRLAPNRGTPELERAARMWWEQVEVRAHGLLGLDSSWLPQADLPLTVGERELDPRPWLDPPSHTVMSWYDEVLGDWIPLDFWRDVWSAGERLPADPANLALAARPMGDGFLDVEGVNDTLVDFGEEMVLPRGDPDAEQPWIGLQWRTPVRLARVSAYTRTRGEAPARSFKGASLEIQGPTGEWVPLGTLPSWSEDAIATWTFPPVETVALRLVITDNALSPLVRELTAHAE